ncbi:unnamed protein product [Rotaria sordida]|uniref:Alpha-1,6-mannosyl-glycoprotein 2-beta-N-acetylglucosaminyltransferase n=2 Tax=Rotaria sordida TaxID=392033 RepID=A0A818P024_9BILA|nr:unnamed protein product [Rotaria sordida]CAF0787971.1 unnamed protein product [Rotaria sordida]CAF0853291.1 unnamed protein product [Rotaria sordida]CAF3615554.1 unnamed protein product [Rotaria sordida]CAF3670792.1 unnamed protein product [Rotaria sordida]
MFRFFRYRCIIFRYIILWLCIITMMKLTIIFYYDLQKQSIDSSSLALPYDDSQLNKENKQQLLNLTTSQIQSINTTITINRTAIEYYRQYVQRKNHEQFMYNNYLFSSKTTRYILLVQVHTRVVYLKKFIEMLQAVQTINQTLLIFSHDFIDPEINTLVTNIKFVPVIQIFYPFSQQLYPDEFPGLDPNDCPRDIAKHKALATRCKNAPYPDKYGHYREVSIVQIKHHWWWKLNFVFNSIEILQNRTDVLVLLLEEDFYLSPDALFFLKKMEDEKERLCPECLIYTLGNLEKSGRQFNNLGSKVSIAYWHARYNLGMTISYSLWLSILQYAEEFCNVDDYNWDWSLVYLAQKRFDYPRVIWSSAARVTHLGSCGTHHKKTCSNQSDIARWEETDKFYQLNYKYLFPTTPLTVHAKYEARRPLKQTNGGWSDLRDRQLCLSFALKNTKDISHINIKI